MVRSRPSNRIHSLSILTLLCRFSNELWFITVLDRETIAIGAPQSSQPLCRPSDRLGGKKENEIERSAGHDHHLCALLIPSAFQTGCDIGRLAFPKYQAANHVTSHTRSIPVANLCLPSCVQVFCANDRFVGDRPYDRFDVCRNDRGTRNLDFFIPTRPFSRIEQTIHPGYKSRLCTL